MTDDLYNVALYINGQRLLQMEPMSLDTAVFTRDYNNAQRNENGLEGFWVVMRYGRETIYLDAPKSTLPHVTAMQDLEQSKMSVLDYLNIKGERETALREKEPIEPIEAIVMQEVRQEMKQALRSSVTRFLDEFNKK